MNINEAQVGMKVRSTTNSMYRGTYTIIKVGDSTVDVQTDDNTVELEDGRIVEEKPYIFKNVELKHFIIVG